MLYNTLSEHVVRGHRTSVERRVWTSVIDTTDWPDAAILFLDAELYVERVKAPQVATRLQHEGSLPPFATVYVSNNGAVARHVDFTCDPDYANFIAEDVVGWMRERCPNIREIVLAGLSLSGLAAAYIATRAPTPFSAAICQSPSFWWESGRFYGDLLPARQNGCKLWVCVGDRETDANVSHAPSGLFQKLTQVEGCDAGCAALRANGYRVDYRKYSGGHDPECWRDDLTLALPWALRQSDRQKPGLPDRR